MLDRLRHELIEKNLGLPPLYRPDEERPIAAKKVTKRRPRAKSGKPTLSERMAALEKKFTDFERRLEFLEKKEN